ncbi:MAG: hypothetical protein RR336_03585 [Oscillospiraceae bacterium]
MEARKAAKIGYYNGKDIVSGPASTLPKPVITVENGLELKVTVTTKSMDWFDKATLTLHVAKENGTGEVKFEMPRFQMVSTQILDSLTDPTNQFQTLFDYGAVIAPGDNLKIWATLDPLPGQSYLSKTSNIEYTNSLFGTYDTATKNVTIANPRHLQNLDIGFSGLVLNDAYTKFSAVQTQSIDWTEVTQAPGAVQNFIPISNEHLASYNGGTKLISGLKVAVDTSAGLFERFSGQTLTGIRLVNPSIIANGQIAGALVGTATNVTVKDCFAYASVPLQSELEVKVSGIIAGGLIGSATNCNISYSGAGMPTVTGTTTAAGGLIGEATTTTVTNSYADTDNLQAAQKDAHVAGFIGSADGKDVKVENCYAVGNCYAVDDNGEKVNKVCGFISGYKNQSVAVSVKNSYCAMTYLDAAGKPIGLENIGGFSRLYGTDNNGAYTNCAYLTPVGVTVSTELPDSKVPDISYAKLAARTTENAIWTKYPMSHPYRDDLQGKAYPFPALKMEKVGTSAQAKMPHYGNWPAAPKGEAFLAYYEEYTDNNTTGFYYLDKDGKVMNTLAGNGKTIKSTRYGILLPEGQKLGENNDGITIDREQIELKCEENPLSTVEINGKKFSFYPFMGEMLDEINEDIEDMIEENKVNSNHSIPVEVRIGGVSVAYQINLNFAAGIAPKNAALGTKDWPLQVRTQEQLQAVNSITVTDKHDCYFLQTHNITIQKSWTAIASFSEIYDGGIDGVPNTITNEAIATPAPIFGTIESGATVKNVVVAGTTFSENYTVSAADGFGFLARTNNGTVQGCAMKNGKVAPGNYVEKNIVGFIWENTGTIENCIVDGFYIEVPYYGIFTGFVNTNHGTIKNSKVTNAEIFGNIGTEKMGATKAEERQIAGFVNINSGSITGCSTSNVILDLKHNVPPSVYPKVEVEAAGFVGQNSGTIQTSYANCTVKGGASASGFVNVNTNEKQYAITNCYAMGSAKATDQNGIASGFAIQSKAKQGINKCYAAVTVYAYNEYQKKNAFGFVPKGVETEECYYVPYGNITKDAVREISYIKAIGGTLLGHLNGNPSSSVWGNTEKSYPYAPELQGKQIPFPTLKENPHYGDWPQMPIKNVGNAIGVFYYEKQADGNYLIDAAAVPYEIKGNAMEILKPDLPNFLNASIPAKNLRSWGEKGFGVLYSPLDTEVLLNIQYQANTGTEQTGSIFNLLANPSTTISTYSFIIIKSSAPNEGLETPYIVLRDNRFSQWECKFQYNTTKNTWTITQIKH